MEERKIGKDINGEREFLLRQLQELQADFEDFTDQDLIDNRECMRNRVNQCLEALGECDEDNLN